MEALFLNIQNLKFGKLIRQGLGRKTSWTQATFTWGAVVMLFKILILFESTLVFLDSLDYISDIFQVAIILC